MIVIVISSIFLILGISALVAGFNENDVNDQNGLIGMGIVITLFSLLLGFGLIAHSTRTSEPEITFSNPIEKIVRSEATTYIKYMTDMGVQTLETDKHSFYVAKDENIKIKRTRYKNVYGKHAWGSEEYAVVIDNTKLEKESP